MASEPTTICFETLECYTAPLPVGLSKSHTTISRSPERATMCYHDSGPIEHLPVIREGFAFCSYACANANLGSIVAPGESRAPEREELQWFGGDMSLKDFRTPDTRRRGATLDNEPMRCFYDGFPFTEESCPDSLAVGFLNFCSPSCLLSHMSRYPVGSALETQIRSKYTILAPAPPRGALEAFGGFLSLERFRAISQTHSVRIVPEGVVCALGPNSTNLQRAPRNLFCEVAELREKPSHRATVPLDNVEEIERNTQASLVHRQASASGRGRGKSGLTTVRRSSSSSRRKVALANSRRISSSVGLPMMVQPSPALSHPEPAIRTSTE